MMKSLGFLSARVSQRPVFKLAGILALAGSLGMGGPARAATYWWDEIGTLGGTGAWDLSTPLWRLNAASGAAGVYGNAIADVALFAGTPGTVTIADALNVNANSLIFAEAGYTIAGGAGSTLTLSGTTPTIRTQGVDAMIGAVLAGTAGLTKTGLGTVTLNGAAVNTYTGSTNVNVGTLKLDFGNLATPTNLIGSTSVLNLNGGTLEIVGKTDTATTQSFASTSFQTGTSVIKAAPASGSTLPTVALGALGVTNGGVVRFEGAGTSTAASTATGQPGANGNGDSTGVVVATATLTTTTAGGTNGALRSTFSGNYATVGLYDYAAVSGGTIIGLSQVTGGTAGSGGYTRVTSGAISTTSGNYDLVGTAFTTGTSGTPMSLRFNSANATTVDWLNGSNIGVTGLLVTPNVGANNVAIINSTVGNGRAPKPGNHAGSGTLAIYQNNSGGFLRMDNGIANNGQANNKVVQSGAGTVVYGVAGGSVANQFRGSMFLNGGVALTATNDALGNGAVGVADSAVNLNSGVLVGTATFALSDGITPRTITLQANGGGLGALSGFTLTVPGVVSGTGGLTFGIPASAANGNVVGQVPGTGPGTANLTSQLATGTVLLSGVNSYTGSTAVYSGTLQISPTGALSGTPSLSVAGGGTLTLENGLSLNDAVNLSLSTGATFNLSFASGAETVNALFLNAIPVTPGTYTAAELSTFDPTITFGSAGGSLTVLAVPEPRIYGLLAAGLAVAFLVRRCRQPARAIGSKVPLA